MDANSVRENELTYAIRLSAMEIEQLEAISENLEGLCTIKHGSRKTVSGMRLLSIGLNSDTDVDFLANVLNAALAEFASVKLDHFVSVVSEEDTFLVDLPERACRMIGLCPGRVVFSATTGV
ncbi:MAG: hypothetical protein VX549_04230 [Pseudomonadota bacterium]|nr:hypothetical protein [Pseudomonadota bacterium]